MDEILIASVFKREPLCNPANELHKNAVVLKKLWEEVAVEVKKYKPLVTMPFTRKWDASCPKIWYHFKQDGRTYIIQDIPPQDDEQALQILVDHLCTDEILCNLSDLVKDQESVDSIKTFWRDCLSQRMSLGCYTEVEGKMTMIGLNVCVVDSIADRFPTTPINGSAWKNVYYAMEFVESKCDTFKILNVNLLLHGYGVVIERKFRGAKLGARLFCARRRLALFHGIKGTSAVFTVPVSQALGTRCGFTTIQQSSLKEIAEAGYQFPETDHLIKIMAQRYDDNKMINTDTF